MARRTVVFQKVPWTGGVNTSVDAGVLPSNDLVQADNVVFSASGSRLKREGFDYFDTELPAVTHRSSSGTTRKLIFASAVSDSNDHIVAVGEKLTIAGSGSASYNTSEAIVSAISTTNVTNDTVEYTFSGAASLAEGSTAASSTTVTRNYDIIAHLDFWYFNASNTAKEHKLVAVTSQGLMFQYDTLGRRKLITMKAGSTSLATTSIAKAVLVPFNNKLAIFLSGSGNTPKKFDGTAVTPEWEDMASNVPDASIGVVHLGRLFCNDKDDPDKLHFCSTFDETEWQGVGDSGAIYVDAADGDPEGINAIFPPFKGRLIVNKGNRSHQVVGEAPEEFQVLPLSSGIGAISHQSAVAYEMDDIFFFSRRGAHSVVATDQFGDFAGKYVSKKIQPTFKDWSEGRLQYSQGVYIQSLNSVAWTVAEEGQTKQNAIWLYNPTIPSETGEMGEWYRWPNMNAQSIGVYLTSNIQRITLGNNAGRMLINQPNIYTETETLPILYRIKSGTIYPDGNPQTVKAFKKFGLLYRPKGNSSFTAYFKVDSMPVQAMTFEQHVDGDILGDDFNLGLSLLGSASMFAPYMKDVVGYGRGFSIEIFQTGVDAQVEVYGYLVEYEPADIADEVVQEG